jgi:hypothetical protein
VQCAIGQPNATARGNGLPGIKWRFIDGGENGCNVSTFPQLEIRGPANSVKAGRADGARFLLPFEISKKLGPVNLDF